MVQDNDLATTRAHNLLQLWLMRLVWSEEDCTRSNT
jgi:hypothetical protein